jgi:hypothetical protein
MYPCATSTSRYMNAHPPRAIASVAFAAHETLRKQAVEAYGDYTTTFGLRCACGSTTWHVRLGHGEYEKVAAVSVACPGCKAAVDCFDVRHDGYDAEAQASHPGAAPASWTTHSCSICQDDRFLLGLTFQYSGDDEELDDPSDVARKQDFYSWFVAAARCECGMIDEVASIECA